MNAADHLGAYAEGWTKGDADTILGAVTDDYRFDDPNAGSISRDELARYLSELKETVRAQRGGKLADPFMKLSEVVTQEAEGMLTAWCWWAVPGTELQGSGLIKAGPGGVRSEVITYYTKLPA
ncbi:nuclear transport factor 2 family protein [Halomonas koreensis]|uniref:Nuclear transport factor 2 family protein n=1 Tax=Halomonas koreensis TaxID=245385 RepID=A0ABU1G0N4_9GAMM|nr:nuclear transport factor 2 family protein [Halomonas koreensis]MDR5866148.1 nuclear transport factor 2 family protein [Halomonas koreensis]